MRRIATVAAAALALAAAAAPARAAERSLLVVGDSLAEGTRPYIPESWRAGG
jgi:hypothetical protein